mmetsp:Transcript_2929/g.7026  ORF Transcript_2929/g.7026 Transcript_2929/m.7026 type:complete len:102 (+) Transcript_2929:943-1248(+)
MTSNLTGFSSEVIFLSMVDMTVSSDSAALVLIKQGWILRACLVFAQTTALWDGHATLLIPLLRLRPADDNIVFPGMMKQDATAGMATAQRSILAGILASMV